jgi:tripartite-type tricarboxylate transporter receptor subunit TctC
LKRTLFEKQEHDMIKRWISLGAAAVFLAAGTAAAQTGNVVRLVIAFPPGGPVDFVARVLADGLGKELGQAVIVENKPGANGSISAQFVAKSQPDGMTLWFTSVGAAAINPSLYESLPYDMQRDFAPVSGVVDNVEVLVVNSGNPANSTSDLVVASKQKKDPTPIGSSGIGSVPHLAMELLVDSTKANLLHVPYKGAAPAITGVMGGEVAGFFGDIPGLIGHIKGGRLKPVGIAAPRRHPLLPEVRTLDEQSIRGVESSNWYALFAPVRTPAARIETLNGAVRRALAADQVHSKLTASGADPAPSSPEELAALVKSDTAKWGKLIRDKKIKGE